MVGKVESCAECTQNCLLIHVKRKDPSAIVTSFFKVMFGDKRSQVMFIPPKFAPTLSSLVDQTIHLEDSSGQRWRVPLSNIDGSLAFQKGWPEFSLAHGLKEGDFLVFNYIKGSHFVVQIYDNTGCEKLFFSQENGSPKKRQTSGNSSPKDGSTRKKGRTSGPHNGSSEERASSSRFLVMSDIEMSESQPIATDNNSHLNKEVNATAPEYVEEQFYMIGRDTGYVQEDYRSALYDLAEFEMNKFSVEVEKNPGPAANSTMQSFTEFDMDMTRFDGDGNNKFTVEDERINGLTNSVMQSLTEGAVVAQDPVAVKAPNVESHLRTEKFIRKDKDSSPRDKLVLFAEKYFEKIDTKLGKNLAMSKTVNLQNPEGRSNAHSSGMAKVVKTEVVEKSEPRNFGFHGKLPSTIRKCDQSLKMPIKDNDILKVVKTEPFTSFDFLPPNTANVSCVVERIDQAFFELPKCLPSISFRRRNPEQKVVYLRDPLRRLWAVFYLEKYGLKVLTGAWVAFCKANSIQPGDECVFGLENEPDRTYTVSIVRK